MSQDIKFEKRWLVSQDGKWFLLLWSSPAQTGVCLRVVMDTHENFLVQKYSKIDDYWVACIAPSEQAKGLTDAMNHLLRYPLSKSVDVYLERLRKLEEASTTIPFV